MCHAIDSLPAIPERGAVTGQHGRLELAASDGSRYSAYCARPAGRPKAGVVILPDNRGLFPFYEALACRLAELGYSALAIDYYGRSAGLADDRDGEFPFMEHLMKVTRAGLESDLAAAVNFLRSDDGGECSAVFALGFCFGGRQAYLAATLGHGLAGVIGFYGYPGAIMGAPGPTDRAAQIASPVLATWAGADQIGLEQIQAFCDAMTSHGVAHDSVIYPGAPHSFFDIRQAEWSEASADAWRRVCDFLVQHASGDVAKRAETGLGQQRGSA